MRKAGAGTINTQREEKNCRNSGGKTQSGRERRCETPRTGHGLGEPVTPAQLERAPARGRKPSKIKSSNLSLKVQGRGGNGEELKSGVKRTPAGPIRLAGKKLGMKTGKRSARAVSSKRLGGEFKAPRKRTEQGKKNSVEQK